MFDEEGRIASARLESLELPTLFVVGEHDQLFPPDALRGVASLIEGAEFVLVPVCGHSTYFEDAAAFNRVVGEFVTRHSR
jgi:pimeloyl-ACP methyl ester carboxylesterase